MTTSKRVLQDLEIEAASDIKRRRRKPKKSAGQRGTRVEQPQGSRSVHTSGQLKAVRREPAAIPINKSLKELKDMDPADPQFKIKKGRPRNPKYEQEDTKDLSYKEIVAREKQRSVNAIRGRARKAEAVTTKALAVVAEERGQTRLKGVKQDGEFLEDEDRLIAEGVLDLDDWDDAELARGYRRGRNGRFGTPPKYIAREIQQEAFRRLVKRGERAMREAYMDIVNGQIDLAKGAESEKVRLDAQVKIQERLIGKVPDTIRVGVENPWQDMLADSLEAIEEPVVLDLEFNQDTGVAEMLPGEDG
jgi:hypothetical protein